MSTTTEKIVTHSDRDDLRDLRSHCADFGSPEAQRKVALLDRLIAEADADAPPLPVGVPLLYEDGYGDERVVYAQDDGRLSVWRDGANTLVMSVEQARGSLSVLRPTITDADVEKAAYAIFRERDGIRYEGCSRDACLDDARAALAAAGIEVSAC